jgi:hypothetical protein
MVVYVGVPHGRDTAHPLRLLAHWLDPSARVMALYCGVPAEPHAYDVVAISCRAAVHGAA